MRLASTSLFLLSASVANVHALPRHHDGTGSSLTWGSAFQNVWDAMRASALGWYDIDIYDELEKTFRAPDKSVYQWLSDNPNFSNITKLINYDPEIKELLDEASHGLTFLAPNNKALTPHKKHKDLLDVRAWHDDALHQLVLHADELQPLVTDDKEDDEDKEKKKRMLKAILNAVLRYHILPYDITSTNLGANSTVQTNLIPKDGSYGGYNRRIKIEKTLIPPSITINKYATIVHGDFVATNGLIHEINHPLFPPPSIIQFAHLAPQWLSTFTSAIQKVGLEEGLDWHYDKDSSSKDKPKFIGSPAVTAFIPDNDAWKKLPEKLILYLFSPFGEKALRKLLQFHVVPNYIIHAEWIVPVDPKKDKFDFDANLLGDVEQDFKFPFPTALKNHTLPIHIKKTTPTLPVPGIANFEFRVFGNLLDRPQFDYPARNGAVHILPSVLNPLKGKHDHDDHGHHGHHGKVRDDENDEHSWDNWEEWLPKWAEEA